MNVKYSAMTFWHEPTGVGYVIMFANDASTEIDSRMGACGEIQLQVNECSAARLNGA
jgi:hypothetical protein